MKNTDIIKFYSQDGPYGELSNFAEFSISLKGRLWPTVEHYFQAQKYAGIPREEDIRRAKKPILAARLGRDRRIKPRKGWEAVKVDIMREALWAKFTQHEELRALLLSTGDAILVEHTPNDSFWGNGGDGSGQNRLGRLLMDIREKLKQPTA